jgi:hypothetical protein
MEKAKYSLEDVFSIIDGPSQSVWFAARSRSVAEVIRVYAKASLAKSESEAVDFILKAFKCLTKRDFVKQHYQWDVVMDIYGINFDGRPWFIKFYLEDEALCEISFHPPNKDLLTISGLCIKGVSNET